jgi:hypothetical protein
MPHKGQSWTPWELNMIGEWLGQTFPQAPYKTQCRLGKIQPRLPNGTFGPDEEAMLGRWRRYVDAVVFLEDRLLLVEAVMKADPGKVSILELYEMLVPDTPELQPYKDLPIQKVLLFAIEDPWLTKLCERKGILAVHFVPSNFEQWYEKLPQRARRPSRAPS